MPLRIGLILHFLAVLSALCAHAERAEIRSPQFVFALDTSDGLRGISWENLALGRKLKLDGPELEVDLDAADRRIGISGWKFGHADDAARIDFDDSAWTPVMTPKEEGWVRRRVKLEESDRG